MNSEAEELVVCPYDKSHSILKGRIQWHLQRCRKNHITSDTVCCPYNSTHIIPRLEQEFHAQVCNSRIVVDSFLYQMGNSDCPVRDTVPINEVNLPPAEENWDEEEPHPSVLDTVKEKAKDKTVLINLIGAPKAERKAHRFNERMRFQRIIDGPQSREPHQQASSSGSRQDVERPKMKDVRLPRGRGAGFEVTPKNVRQQEAKTKGARNKAKRTSVSEEDKAADLLRGLNISGRCSTSTENVEETHQRPGSCSSLVWGQANSSTKQADFTSEPSARCSTSSATFEETQPRPGSRMVWDQAKSSTKQVDFTSELSGRNSTSSATFEETQPRPGNRLVWGQARSCTNRADSTTEFSDRSSTSSDKVEESQPGPGSRLVWGQARSSTNQADSTTEFSSRSSTSSVKVEESQPGPGSKLVWGQGRSFTNQADSSTEFSSRSSTSSVKVTDTRPKPRRGWGSVNNCSNQADLSEFPSLPVSGRGRGRTHLPV